MNQFSPNNSQNSAAPDTGFSLDDIYFTFFRHKFLISGCVVLGLLAALVARMVTPPMYSSKATLRVSYVAEEAPVNAGDANGPRIVIPMATMESIPNTEIEIMRSRDVCVEVAGIVGPDKILAAYGGGNDTNAAAGLIKVGLGPMAPKRSDVIIVFFEHRDKSVVQPTLNALVNTYFRHHAMVHLGLGSEDAWLVTQLENLRNELVETERDLESLMRSNKVSSISETRGFYLRQIERLTGEWLTAKTDLALLTARMGIAAGTNTTNSSDTKLSAPLPRNVIREYSDIVTRLQYLENHERRLISEGLKPAHPYVQDARIEMAQRSAAKLALETKYPMLENVGSAVSMTSTNTESDMGRIHDLTATVTVYEQQIANMNAEVASISKLEPRMMDLQRKHDLQLAQYEKLSSKVKGFDSRAGRVPGVKFIENPTLPIKSDERTKKIILGVLGGFAGLGIVIAVLLDYVFDRSIKRSVDIERHLRQKVFFAIPDTFWKNSLKLPWRSENKSIRKRTPEEIAANKGETGIAPWNPLHHLRPYTEGLRERLVTYFEINGNYHKPKLVGLTSCGDGAGVTTLANGLAASLSLTGDGNVLLVDLNGGNGVAHSFYKGKPGCGVSKHSKDEDEDEEDSPNPTTKLALAKLEARDKTQNKLAKILPEGFDTIVPNLETSEYDFIVFDMAPVAHTSPTPRLASQMDVILMVFESEKTGVKAAQQASVLMQESRANMANVINKCRRYVPAKLTEGL